MTANVFETRPYCAHPEHEHEHPYGCSRCACDESFWGFEEEAGEAEDRPPMNVLSLFAGIGGGCCA